MKKHPALSTKVFSYQKFLSQITLFVKTNRLVILLSLLILVGTLRLVLVYPISPDSWLHLAIGKYILQERSIPNHNDISFKQVEPVYGWMSHSWLADIILYIAGSTNIIFGSIFIIFPLLLLCCYLLNEILLLYEIPKEIRFIAILFSIIISLTFWNYHPFVFITPLLVVMCLLYLQWMYTGSKLILILPLLMLLWANFSGGFIFIPIGFFLIVLISEGCIVIANRLTKQRIHQGKYRVLVFSVFSGIAITVFNPYTFLIWAYPFTVFSTLASKYWYSTLPGLLLLINQNFIRENPSTILYAAFMFYMLGTLLLTLFLLIRHPQKSWKKLTPLIPFLLFFFLAGAWIRFIPITIFPTMIVFAVSISLFFNIYSSRIFRWIKKSLSVFIVLFFLYIAIFPPQKIALEIPTTQIELIKKLSLPGNILTTGDITGYALYSLYPDKFSIDARDDLFDEHEMITIYYLPAVAPEEELKQITTANNINTILVHKEDAGIANSLNRSPDWALIYFDTSGYLYVRLSAVSEDFITENGLKYQNFARELGFNPEEATAAANELETFTKRYPQSSLALGQLASIYRFQKQFTKAEITLQKIPQEKRDYIYFTEMGRIKAAEIDCKSAEENFKKALNDRKEQTYSRAVLDLAVVYAGCLHDKDQAKHYFNRYNSFVLSPTEREKVRQLASQFGISLDE